MGVAAVVGVVLALLLVIVFSGGDEPVAVASRPTTPQTSSAQVTEPVPSPATDPVESPTDAIPANASAPLPREQEPAESTADPAEMSIPDVPSAEPVPNGAKPEIPVQPSDEPPGLTEESPTNAAGYQSRTTSFVRNVSRLWSRC